MGRKSLNEGHPDAGRPARRASDGMRMGAAGLRGGGPGPRYRIGASPDPNAVKIRVISAFQLALTSGKSPTET